MTFAKLRQHLRVCRALRRRRHLRAMAELIHERNRQAVAQMTMETGGPVYARSDETGKLTFYPDAKAMEDAAKRGSKSPQRFY